MEKLKKKKAWRDILTLLDTPAKERDKRENKRVIEYLEKKKKLDAQPQNACCTCGRLIPSPMIYCSSECWRKGNEKEGEKAQ